MPLFFAIYVSKENKLFVYEREAELHGEVFCFQNVRAHYSRIHRDDVDSLVDETCAVASSKEKAISLLKDRFRSRADKLRRESERLRVIAELVPEMAD